MASVSSPPGQYTSYKMEPQQLHPEAKQHGDANLAFTRAAFAFRDGLDHKRVSNVTVSEVQELPEAEAGPTADEIAEKAHKARHKRRIRIARTIQHILTSLLSIAVAGLQGQMYYSYQSTKNVSGAWPVNANLVPTLMLFATAIIALFVDFCALTAYLWPSSSVGRMAFSLANSANYVIKTFKAIAYAYSTVVCKTMFDQGNASGMNTDLWSWTCSPKADAHANITHAGANCLGSYIAWYLSFANIGIEVLGIVIDQIVARDEEKWKSKSNSKASAEMKPTKGASSGAAKPLLGGTAAIGITGKGKYQKLTDDEYDQLDKLQGGYDGELNSAMSGVFKKESK